MASNRAKLCTDFLTVGISFEPGFLAPPLWRYFSYIAEHCFFFFTLSSNKSTVLAFFLSVGDCFSVPFVSFDETIISRFACLDFLCGLSYLSFVSKSLSKLEPPFLSSGNFRFFGELLTAFAFVLLEDLLLDFSFVSSLTASFLLFGEAFGLVLDVFVSIDSISTSFIIIMCVRVRACKYIILIIA